jgi:hypothetical protein
MASFGVGVDIGTISALLRLRKHSQNVGFPYNLASENWHQGKTTINDENLQKSFFH